MASPSDAAQASSLVFVKGGPCLTMYISGTSSTRRGRRRRVSGRAMVAFVGVFEMIRAGHARCCAAEYCDVGCWHTMCEKKFADRCSAEHRLRRRHVRGLE